jgi:hypothetical protein
LRLRKPRSNQLAVRSLTRSARSVRSAAPSVFIAAALGCIVGCNTSNEYSEPGPRPQILNAAGPKDAVVSCDPATVGGACPLPVSVTFRLPEDQFVWKALVRFQGDGSDQGVDRAYLLDQVFGKGSAKDVSVTVNANIPPNIVRTGALFTYTVRLVTGAGEESTVSTLTVSVQ